MSQDDSVIEFGAKLYKEDEVDYLEFLFDEIVHKLNLNLEDNQNDIKNMFCDLVPLLKNNQIQISLSVEDGFENKLLKEVVESYIHDLNQELTTVRGEILDNEENL